MKKSEKPIANKPWLEAHHQQPTPFSDSMFSEDGDGGTFAKSKLMLQVDEFKNFIDEYVNSSPRLVPENYLYTLGIHTHLPPHVPVHLTRVQLKHSILEADAAICLFVKDLKTPEAPAVRSGRKTTHQNDPYEHTVKHYEKLLKQHGIDSNITIITMKQLFAEYVTIDERRKLYFMYDKLLVDENISLIINSYLGYKMIFEGRIALPIDLNASKLTDEFNTVIRTGPILYRIYENRGKIQHIRIGRHTSMSTEEMVENIIEFLQHCDMLIAGGTANIERITLKPNVHVSRTIDLYLNRKPVAFPTPLVKTDDDEIKIESNDNNIKNEDFDVSMIDEEMEKLLERNWTENSSVIGPDFICDDNDDDQIRFIYYRQSDDDDDDDDDDNNKNKNQMGEKAATTNNVAKTNNSNNNQANKSPSLNGRNPEEINRLIMEGLKKILRTGTLPQLSGRGLANRGVDQSNNPIARRGRRNRVQ